MPAIATEIDLLGSPDDRSTKGTFTGGKLITWRSKQPGGGAGTSVEAEYRAMAHGVCELLWLKKMVTDLKIINGKPLVLFLWK